VEGSGWLGQHGWQVALESYPASVAPPLGTWSGLRQKGHARPAPGATPVARLVRTHLGNLPSLSFNDPHRAQLRDHSVPPTTSIGSVTRRQTR